jgi:hypothetical protein
VGPLVNRNKYPVTFSSGLKVLINNQSFTPNANDDFISIEQGKETNIKVDRAFTSYVPKPYNGCTDLTQGFNSELYNFIVDSNKTYRQKIALVYVINGIFKINGNVITQF